MEIDDNGAGWYPFAAKPIFSYKKEGPWYALQKHVLHVRWENDQGTTWSVRPGDLFWKTAHEYCQENFTRFGSGFFQISYFVSPSRNRIEFRRKAHAMQFKMVFG